MKGFLILTLTCIVWIFASGQNSNINSKSGLNYKPDFHFSTNKNWINDPNGLFYLKGKYHLFFQYNPLGNIWGHMSWGHAISSDLIHWKELPVAIPEFTDANGKTTMIFSGSAVVDSLNTSGLAVEKSQIPLIAIYTSNVLLQDKQIAQHQSIAYSLDEGLTWKQYKGNPVLDIGSKEFRDPKVFWYAPTKKWIMVVSKATEHIIQFYESDNLIKWNYLSEIGGIGNVNTVWECPDLYQLPIGRTKTKKWILSLSAGHPQNGYLAMQYFVGNFDGKKFIADPLNYPRYVDFGKDYYAGVTFNNIPDKDGRRIMIGWANCWLYARDIPTSNDWRGVYTIPRKLSLKETNNGPILVQEPIAELLKYEKVISSNEELHLSNTSKKLDVSNQMSLDISFDINVMNSKRAGLKLLKGTKEETVISFEKGLVTLDRTKSGNIDFNKAFTGVDSVKLNNVSDNISVRILIDKCIVEVFVNKGEYTLTNLVFPIESKNQIELFEQGGAAVFKKLRIASITPKP